MTVLALLLLGGAAGLIRFVRFRRLAWLLGLPLGAVGYSPLLDKRETERARQIRRAVGRAAAVAPFRSDCLPQALVAGLIARLLDVPLAIHLGVDLAAEGMAAHAWSVAGPVAVSGGHGFARFTIVGCYVHDPIGDRGAAR